MKKPHIKATPVYYKGNHLYFDTADFDNMVASKIGGVTSNVNLKKTLSDAGLLKYNKDGEYSVKVKLSGTDLQERYTTVSVDLLTEQAKELLPSAFATFLQCTDNVQMPMMKSESVLVTMNSGEASIGVSTIKIC